MSQYDNKDLMGLMLKSAIGVIGRRTSDSYANVIVDNSLGKLSERYPFLNYVHIKGTKYTEVFEIVTIDQEINEVNIEKIGNILREFLENIILQMGKNAGYYFLREIKEDLPFSYIESIKNIGVDLDYLQLKFITEIKNFSKFNIENHDIFKNVFNTVFEILDRNIGKDSAYLILSETVSRLQIQNPELKYLKINDIRSIQNVDAITVDNEIDQVLPSKVGTSIQKCIQELNNNIVEKNNISLIEKIKNSLNNEYILKLEELGVNLDIIQLKQTSVVKHVLKALIEVLSRSSTESYAIVMINNVIKQFEDSFEFLKNIRVDGLHFSEGLDAIIVPEEIESIRQSDLGRSIQKIIDRIVKSLGQDAGKYFIDKLKDELGKAYVLRIEEMGVNLHMIELRQSLKW
jgi:hypothetical protein